MLDSCAAFTGTGSASMEKDQLRAAWENAVRYLPETSVQERKHKYANDSYSFTKGKNTTRSQSETWPGQGDMDCYREEDVNSRAPGSLPGAL